MTVSIRASLLISALAMAGLTAAFSAPPAQDHATPAPGPATPDDTSARPHAAHWGYGGEGGPQHWGDLGPENRACAAGVQQSPIDIAGALSANVAAPAPRWTSAGNAQVVNNGHTLQVNVAGSGGLTLAGKDFVLKQFHFHHPSEHTIDGRSFPLEVHFVHAAADGDLAVIGVMFEPGAVNPALNPIWAVAPAREGAAEAAGEIDLAAFRPKDMALYRYEGSLTTPPCSETVHWTVMSQPITASPSQIAAFAQLFPMNARPVQPLNRRYVLKTAG
jgi:carbonic anhydrase